MGTALSGFFVLSILFTATMVFFRINLLGTELVRDSIQEATQLEEERAGARISVASTTGVIGTNTLRATVDNEGDTSVADFAKMDVVVQYTLVSITYADYGVFTTLSSPQPSDTWRALSISNDVIDPRVLNTGESLNGTLRVFPAVGTGTSNWLQVTTELGISASSFFTN